MMSDIEDIAGPEITGFTAQILWVLSPLLLPKSGNVNSDSEREQQ